MICKNCGWEGVDDISVKHCPLCLNLIDEYDYDDYDEDTIWSGEDD